MTRAHYAIDSDRPGSPLIIRDLNRAGSMSVTNDAEAVVADLIEQGRLTEGRRLLYFDSCNTLDEILVREGRFAGFAPGPR